MARSTGAGLKSAHSILGIEGRYVPTSVHAGLLAAIQLLDRLSPRARHRAAVLAWHSQHGSVVRLTARHFGLSPDTVSRWARAMRERGPAGLEDRSQRPVHLRRPTTPLSAVIRIRAIREAYPRWGREKIRTLLLREGISVSAKTIDRTILRLRSRGDLREPVSARRRAKRQQRRERPQRPAGLLVDRPGALLQLDSKQVQLGHRPVFVLGAVDHFTRKRVVAVVPRLSAEAGAAFLEHVRSKLPFPLAAVQTDGGSEFMGGFIAAAAAAGITRYVNRPNYPQGQGRIERTFLTDEQEFYEVEEMPKEAVELERMLVAWNKTYEEIRPHQALGYLTPNEFYARWAAGQSAP